MSILPPTLRGGTMLCSPASAGATPIVPAKGRRGTLPPGPYIAGARVVASYFQIWSFGSLNWSASRPKPGILAVQPQPDGLNESTFILSASPGCAPSTKTGPVTGLTSEKSSFVTSAVVEVGVSWPHDGSRVSNCTVSPGAIVRRGGKALFQP